MSLYCALRKGWLSLGFILLFSLCLVSARESIDSDMRCRALRQLKFEDSPPQKRRQSLDICNKYRMSTCCNSTHVDILKRSLVMTWAANFSVDCRSITEEVICSACNPMIGTRRLTRFCPDLCDSWFDACKNEYYSASSDGTINPCYGSALICSPLHLIFDSGRSFCKSMGHEIGDKDDTGGIDCFDGSVPPEVGIDEPTEPFFDWLHRMLKEQTENPSDFFTIATMVSILCIFLAAKLWKSGWESNISSGKLTMEEVRQFQQQNYVSAVETHDNEKIPSESESLDSD